MDLFIEFHNYYIIYQLLHDTSDVFILRVVVFFPVRIKTQKRRDSVVHFFNVTFRFLNGSSHCRDAREVKGDATVQQAEVRCWPLAVFAGRAAAVRHFSSATGSICSRKQWELHQTCCRESRTNPQLHAF